MGYDDLTEIIKVMDQKSESENKWSLIPENVLIKILKYLSVKDILSCSECCKRWNFVAHDSLLWKEKFLFDYKIDKKIPRKPGNYIANR